MRADGGGIAAPARADGGNVTGRAAGGSTPMSYTNTPNNVEEEAAGKKRQSGGGVKRARGGALKNVGMEGMKMKHRRLDRPGRKRGGGVGADNTPMSTAATVRPATEHKADNDEMP